MGKNKQHIPIHTAWGRVFSDSFNHQFIFYKTLNRQFSTFQLSNINKHHFDTYVQTSCAYAFLKYAKNHTTTLVRRRQNNALRL